MLRRVVPKLASHTAKTQSLACFILRPTTMRFFNGQKKQNQQHTEHVLTSSEMKSDNQPKSTPEKQTLVTRVKGFLKKYGAVGLIFYFGMYFSTLGALYLVFQQGLLPTREVLIWLSERGFEKWIDPERISSSQKYANFAVAYILNRCLEPIRLYMTYFLTPKVSAMLKRVFRK